MRSKTDRAYAQRRKVNIVKKLILAIRSLALAAILATSAAHAENLYVVLDNDIAADRSAEARQQAQCTLDADKYVDEHPGPAGMTTEQTVDHWALTRNVRYGLCMQAAGYPVTYANHPVREGDARVERIYAKWRATRSEGDLAWFRGHVQGIFGGVQWGLQCGQDLKSDPCAIWATEF
jgi:hypothetical protein